MSHAEGKACTPEGTACGRVHPGHSSLEEQGGEALGQGPRGPCRALQRLASLFSETGEVIGGLVAGLGLHIEM